MVGNDDRQRGCGFLSGIWGEGLRKDFERVRMVFASVEAMTNIYRYPKTFGVC